MASNKGQPKPLKKGPNQGKMDPMQRARYLAYEQPNKSVAASIAVTQTRLKEHAVRSQAEPRKQIPNLQQERQAKVVGQLKAAEARNRIRLMRFRFQCMKKQHKIEQQTILAMLESFNNFSELRGHRTSVGFLLLTEMLIIFQAQELNNLISCQPTARDATRLEVFLPPRTHTADFQDSLTKIQRERVEDLLEDDGGLLTNRIL